MYSVILIEDITDFDTNIIMQKVCLLGFQFQLENSYIVSKLKNADNA